MFNLYIYFKDVSFWEPVLIPHKKYEDQGLYANIFLTIGQVADHYLYVGTNYKTVIGNLFNRTEPWELKTETLNPAFAHKIQVITYVVTLGILPLIALAFKLQYKRFLNYSWKLVHDQQRDEPAVALNIPKNFPSFSFSAYDQIRSEM